MAIAINQVAIELPGSIPGFSTGTVEGNGCMSTFFNVKPNPFRTEFGSGFGGCLIYVVFIYLFIYITQEAYMMIGFFKRTIDLKSGYLESIWKEINTVQNKFIKYLYYKKYNISIEFVHHEPFLAEFAPILVILVIKRNL